MRRAALAFIFILFAGYSAFVCWKVGYLGIWRAGFLSLATIQLVLDLVIACLILSVWIYADAKKRSKNPWPWLVATLLLGTLSPLLYLFLREPQRQLE